MKRITVAVLLLFSLGIIPLFAQASSPAENSGANGRPGGARSGAGIAGQLATPEGRIKLFSMVTGIPESEIRKAQQIYLGAEQELKADRAEIEVRKAELTRALIDTNPNMTNVQDLLHQSMDWEYKLRLATIQRDLKVRSALGDENWSKLQMAMKLVRQFSARAAQRRTGGPAANQQPVNPRERELLNKLMQIEAQGVLSGQ